MLIFPVLISPFELVKPYIELEVLKRPYLDNITADHQGIIFTDEIGKVYQSWASVGESR
jgi:hypothetical protein